MADKLKVPERSPALSLVHPKRQGLFYPCQFPFYLIREKKQGSSASEIGQRLVLLPDRFIVPAGPTEAAPSPPVVRSQAVDANQRTGVDALRFANGLQFANEIPHRGQYILAGQHESFYIGVAPEEPLAQGDIFDGVPVITPLLHPLTELILEEAGHYHARSATAWRKGMVVPAVVEEVTRAIILTQSCDARRQDRIQVAPVRPFVAKDPQPAKLWPQISALATTLTQVGTVYLTGWPKAGFPRQIIDLADAFTIQRRDLEELARAGHRHASFGPDGINYLQARLGLFFCRYAREDFGWQSKADLQLWADDLARQIEKLGESADNEERRANSSRTEPGEAQKAGARAAEFKEKREACRELLERVNAEFQSKDEDD